MVSAVHQGVAFEQRSLKLLHDNLSMSLRRIGGKSDGGIDLLGWWWLPTRHAKQEQQSSVTGNEYRLRILAQCKAEKRKTSPKYIRELEGVMARFSMNQHEHEQPQHPLVGLFLSESSFTKSTLLRAQSSAFPFFLLHVPPASEGGLGIGAAMWNLSLMRLLGDDIQVRWEMPSTGSSSSQGRPGVWSRRCDGSWTRLSNMVPTSASDHLSGDSRFEDAIRAL